MEYLRFFVLYSKYWFVIKRHSNNQDAQTFAPQLEISCITVKKPSVILMCMQVWYSNILEVSVHEDITLTSGDRHAQMGLLKK